MADRIGIIDKGELILVEEKVALMKKLGKKQLTLHLRERIDAIPAQLAAYGLALSADGNELTYAYTTRGNGGAVTALLDDVTMAGLAFSDITTNESKLEDIFIDLVRQRK